jgi:hypothetical protein
VLTENWRSRIRSAAAIGISVPYTTRVLGEGFGHLLRLVLSSTIGTVSTPAMSTISRLYPTARTIAVYASQSRLLHRHARLASGWLAILSAQVESGAPQFFALTADQSVSVGHIPQFRSQQQIPSAPMGWVVPSDTGRYLRFVIVFAWGACGHPGPHVTPMP